MPMGRGVHGLVRSGLCPTCNRSIIDRVGRFSTLNRPVRMVGICGSVFRRVASVLGEAETRRKTQKNGQNRRDPAQSSRDPVKISSNPMIFPPNLAENSRIWCINAGSDCFGHRNLQNQAENSLKSLDNSPEFDVFGQVGFHGI